MRSGGRFGRTITILVATATAVTIISLGVASAQDSESTTQDKESAAQEGNATQIQGTTQDSTTESVTSARKKKRGARTLTKVFTNPNLISFSGLSTGVATPYPSPITVSGFPRGSRVTDVNITFNDFNSTNPDDVAVMLAQGERNQGVMADVGGTADVVGYTFTLDDEASATLPNEDPLQSPTIFQYKPARYGADWPSPAPSALSVFDGLNPNGTWNLFIVDNGFGNNPFTLEGGYSLTITARSPRR